MWGVGCQQRPHRFLKIIKLKNLKEQIKALKVNRWVNVVTFVLFGHGSLSLVLSLLQICLIGELGTTYSKSILVSNVFSFTSICVICRITYIERVIVSHEPRPPTLSERFSAYCWGSCLPSCDNPLSCLFGTLTCGGSSQSRNGSSWQSSPRQSASLAWPRSVCTKLRITGDYCCWPPPRATPTWWASWQRGRRGTGRPTWPFSPASCRDGGWKKRERDGTGREALFESTFRWTCTCWQTIWIFSAFLSRVCPDWTNVWSFSSKQIDCQRLHFWRERICPAMCQGKVGSAECTAHARVLSSSAQTAFVCKQSSHIHMCRAEALHVAVCL